MKILQIGYLDPYKNFGGVEAYISNMVSGLHNALGYESQNTPIGSEGIKVNTQ